LIFGLQVIGVAVLVDDDFGPAEAAPVNNGGVVQPVGEDDVLPAHQGRDGGLVGAEAGLDVEGVLHVLELGDLPLQFHVDGEGARDGADRRRPTPQWSSAWWAACTSRGCVARPR
jgi:hypothetical protein